MLRASVLIPTHEHAATLSAAVASVQAQAGADVEILIVGDGVDDALRALAAGLAAGDSRIRFFDFPKGARHGEAHRDDVLRAARGRIVCYQADDDLWLPGHLDAMDAALEEADFVGAMHVNVDTDGTVHGYQFNFEQPAFLAPWLAGEINELGAWASQGHGLAFAGHSLEAYRRLPEGWAPAPEHHAIDQTMWRKFLRQPWCRARYLPYPIALHFPAPDRAGWPPERRAAELAEWQARIAAPQGVLRIHELMFAELGERLLHDAAARSDRPRAAERAAAEALSGEQALRRQAEADHEAAQALLRQRALEIAAAQSARLQAEADAHVLEQRLQERARALAEQQSLRESAEALGRSLEQRLHRAEADLAAEQSLRRAVEAHGDRLRQTADRQALDLGVERGLRSQVQQERDDLLASTSWRIGAPLRAVADGLKRIATRKNGAGRNGGAAGHGRPER